MYNFFRSDMTYSSIMSFASGDVNGDKIPENVYLTGVRGPDSPFIQNITLVIQDVRTGRFTNIPISENAGYDPKVFLGHFTEYDSEDIMISINSGGSGAIMYHYIYSFLNNNPQLLFDFNVYNKEYNYEVNYMDGYKVQVLSKINHQKYIIDISTRGSDYLNAIYEPNGKLKKPISGFVNPLSGLYPVDFDSNGIYELLAYQKIAGLYDADSLGYVLNTLGWDGKNFALTNQQVAIF
ncbi:VCBS repeat-containing protein [Clostridium sp. 19966]|uniref:VCBS repeat-containing protein n=1 Tax=Clostridium sp. 19966 TaxID=2768166 RepID=UPI0028DF35B9|nr:VCBS repeat-containing protein [Clostridium sp. 19966]MDT8718763.1 VCBS repeat-containing protein [Clostridium sp. 19966]